MFSDERANRAQVELPELFTRARWYELATHLGLTERQRQVARLVCCGRTNAQIAQELGVSHGTVRLHSDGLYKALGVRNRVGVVVKMVLVDRKLPRIKSRLMRPS